MTEVVDNHVDISVYSYVVFWCVRYLQLLLLEHVRSGGVEYVVSKLSLAIYIDRCCGFTGQEAVVDLPGTLRELEEVGGSSTMSNSQEGGVEGGGDVVVQIKRQ